MKDKDDSINERRRQRIRERRRKELEQEIENEIPGSEFTPTIERRLAEHQDAARDLIEKHGLKEEVAPEEIMSPLPPRLPKLRWRDRCAIQLARFTLWVEKKWKRFWKKGDSADGE